MHTEERQRGIGDRVDQRLDQVDLLRTDVVVLAPECSGRKQFTFRGTPAALKGLRRHSGIDVLNLANNHVGDFGREATVDTVRAVEGLGMRAVGAGPDLRRALAPTTTTLNRVTAGARPIAQELAAAMAELGPRSGMQRQPPLGVWMIVWAQKPS